MTQLRVDTSLHEMFSGVSYWYKHIIYIIQLGRNSNSNGVSGTRPKPFYQSFSFFIASIMSSVGRTEYERKLTELYEATHTLLTQDTKQEICTVIVETAQTVLELPITSVHLFNNDTRALEPIANTSEAIELFDTIPTFEEGDGLAWNVFRDGDVHLYENVQNEPDRYNVETLVQTEIIAPIGEHGVLMTGATSVAEFSDYDRKLLELLAVNTEAALDRIERQRELEYQRDELSRLNRINAVIRDINQLIVKAETRSELEQAVCNRLAASDVYLFAWIGEPDYQTGELVPQASAGEIGDYLETITFRVDENPGGRGPAGKAVRSGETQVVQDIHQNPAFESVLETITEYGYESIASVPILYEQNLYGVLSVYSASPNAFDTDEQTVLSELGETIGLAISSREQRRALMSESLIELEFWLSDTLQSLVDVTADGTCSVEINRTVAIDDGYLQYITVDGIAPSCFQDTVEQIDGINTTKLIDQVSGEYLFEVSIGDLPLQEAIEPYGGHIPSMVIENGKLRFTVELPPSADISHIVDKITTVFPDADLLAQRTVTRKSDSVIEYQSELTERLTERQRTALEVAYFSGHYHWPRQTTGEELADRLDISPATFSEHLRAAEHKTFDMILPTDSAERID
jgi:HTH-type transcriptional regulator, bacterioopsin transcriptional activator and related proteins